MFLGIGGLMASIFGFKKGGRLVVLSIFLYVLMESLKGVIM